MNRMSLAVKYLTRRKSRTFLILIVFLVINVMAFTVISIRKAAKDALANLEQNPPDYFYLDSKYEADPKSVVAEGSTISFLSVPYLITDEEIEKIMSTGGIRTYAVRYASLSGEISDKNGSSLALVAYNIPVAEYDASSIIGISDSYLHLGSGIKLEAGRHITPDSKREAMVSVQFAKRNNLNAGDKLSITMPGNTSVIEVTLSGIYEFTDKADEAELCPSELRENFIYVDYDTALALDNGKQGIVSVEFFVYQPDQLSAIFARVQKLDIDWNKYSLFNDTDAFVTNANSVKALSNQFLILTAVIILAGFLVITLVLMLQTKMRANETAIFLSLGFTKSRIVLQHIIEVMIPAGISIAAAYFTGAYLISGKLFHVANIAVNHIQAVTVVKIIVINFCMLIASICISGARILSAPPGTVFRKDN